MGDFKLKDMYNIDFVRSFATTMSSVYPTFEAVQFCDAVVDVDWAERELKQRMRHITTCLHKALPSDYEQALLILLRATPMCKGFPYMFFPDFVESYGLQYERLSLDALELMTQYSSAEFAIRPFIKQNPQGVMERICVWARHDNEHVRRLASEGCRPRLPWAVALPDFQHDPSPIFPILEILKRDESEYVRRSVANNLNDITKDHPELVINTARQWYGQHAYTDWILKHGCRTLLKRGEQKALALFGFGATQGLSVQKIQLSANRISIGDAVYITFDLLSSSAEPVEVRVDFAVDYVKARGTVSRKVFKVVERHIEPNARECIKRKLRFQNFTTRTHYPGVHRVTVVINGVEMASAELLLDVVPLTNSPLTE